MATNQLSSIETGWLSYVTRITVIEYQYGFATGLLRFSFDRSRNTNTLFRCNTNTTKKTYTSRTCQTAHECIHGFFANWTPKNRSIGTTLTECRYQQVNEWLLFDVGFSFTFFFTDVVVQNGNECHHVSGTLTWKNRNDWNNSMHDNTQPIK